MQLEVQAGSPITLTGLDEAPDLNLGGNTVITIDLGADQGLPGPPGPAGVDLSGVAAATLNGHRAVAWSAGLLVHADPSTPVALAGVIESAATIGETVSVRASGVVTHSGWSWSAGPVWYGASGALTQTQPVGYPRVIGRGDGTRLYLDIQPPVQVI